MALKKYMVLHPISSLSQDNKIFKPGEIYEADLSSSVEQMLIDMGRIEPYTEPPKSGKKAED